MSDLEDDKKFKTSSSTNALCAQFDEHNGDFDTPAEFIRAYLNNDARALAALSVQNMEQLRDVLEDMYPEIREALKEETTTPQNMKKYLKQLADKNTPEPIP